MEYSGKTKNPDGSSMMQYTQASVDIDQLTQMAELTGGHFYLASDDNKLGKIYDLIDRLETTDYEIKGQWKRKEEAAYFLFPALLLLFVEFGLRYTVFDSLT
jgi:Ca-activated chloride channel family protein